MNVKHVYEGHEDFRWRLSLALISHQNIKIRNIRSKTSNPGITSYEFAFMKLLEKLSNGTTIRVNDTGTVVTFMPGTLIGGNITHKCGLDRGMGYFLEPLMLIAMYCKDEMFLTLTGVTNCTFDPSVDVFINAWLPLMKEFIGAAAASELNIKIIKRGLLPKGGGEVFLKTKPTTKILPINHTRVGKLYKIRGIAWTTNVNPSIGSRMIKGAKELLNKVLSDVYINIDHRKKDSAGKSPGYGMCLWGTSKENAVISAEFMTNPLTDAGDKAELPILPSEIGLTAAGLLLNQIYCGGFVDSTFQSLICAFMALEGGKNASQIILGSPTTYTIHNLRLIDDMLGVKFHFKYNVDFEKEQSENIEENTENEDTLDDTSLIVTCFGSGLLNSNRALL